MRYERYHDAKPAASGDGRSTFDDPGRDEKRRGSRQHRLHRAAGVCVHHAGDHIRCRG
nr:MAG TPA: hypothetical protein [Caudoviricetes sp.]